MSSDMLVMRSIANAAAHTPAREKSMLRKWVEEISTSGGASMQRARIHAVAAGQAVRQNAESMLTGAALGAASAYLPGGLDNPHAGALDGWVAGVGFLGGIALANEEVGPTVRNAGAAGSAVLAFRKTHDFTAKKMAERGMAPGGPLLKKAGSSVAGEADFGEDPIVAFAKRNFG